MNTETVLKSSSDKLLIEVPAKTYQFVSFDLTERASDKKIEDSLPKEHIFQTADVYALIGQLISSQSKGEEGVLLSNGNSNLFYTDAFVVGVHWDGGAWVVRVWIRVGRGWVAGRRVFFPVN